MYKILKQYLDERKRFLEENKILIEKTIPITVHKEQIGLRVEFLVKAKSAGSFSVRTTETGYHIYDWEVIDFQPSDYFVAESNMVDHKRDLVDKIESFLKRLAEERVN